MRKYIALLGLAIIIVQAFMHSLSFAEPTVFISEEVGHNTKANREAANTLDDEWQNAVVKSYGENDIIQPSLGVNEHDQVTELVDDKNDPQVKVTTVGVNPNDLSDFQPDTQGKQGSANSTYLQNNSPKPTSSLNSPYYNETGGSSKSLNGVLFEFQKPLFGFGAWFGDLETRNDGQGLPAYLQFFNNNRQQIGDKVEVQSSTEDQSLCSNSYVGCGNKTTRWIGFIDPTGSIKSMVVTVGDEDAQPKNPGTTERISFTGAKFAVYNPALHILKITPPAPAPTQISNASLKQTAPASSSLKPNDSINTTSDNTPIAIADNLDHQQPKVEQQGRVLGITNNDYLANTGANTLLSLSAAVILIIIAGSTSLMVKP